MYYLLSGNVVICEYTFEHAYSISEMIHKKPLCVLNSDSLGQGTDGETGRRRGEL